jgi:hypothetical protein
MATSRQLPLRIIRALNATKSLRLRVGSNPHRFIGIWVVVVRGRVFVRSWELRATGWYHTLRREPVGEIQVGLRTLPISARSIRSEAVLRAVDEAYAAKYAGPGSLKYVRGFRRGRRRASTMEILPA